MVEYISYKGEKYPLRIAYSVTKHLQVETGKSIDDLDEDVSILEIILFYGLKSGAKAEGVEFKLTREDMEDVLDEMGIMEFVEKIKIFFPSAEDTDQKKVK